MIITFSPATFRSFTDYRNVDPVTLLGTSFDDAGRLELFDVLLSRLCFLPFLLRVFFLFKPFDPGNGLGDFAACLDCQC